MSVSTAAWAARYIEMYGMALVQIPPGHKFLSIQDGTSPAVMSRTPERHGSDGVGYSTMA